MLSCVPRSIFSGDYDVMKNDMREGAIVFNWGSEQGEIELHGQVYYIVKKSMFGGPWSLLGGDLEILVAEKPSAFAREMEIRGDGGVTRITASSMFSSDFEITHDSAHAGTICREGLFSRRAIINCSDSMPQLTQLFAFWLVALMWRRAARSAHGTPGA
jgi:hypothetical protein